MLLCLLAFAAGSPSFCSPFRPPSFGGAFLSLTRRTITVSDWLHPLPTLPPLFLPSFVFRGKNVYEEVTQHSGNNGAIPVSRWVSSPKYLTTKSETDISTRQRQRSHRLPQRPVGIRKLPGRQVVEYIQISNVRSDAGGTCHIPAFWKPAVIQ